MDLERIIRLLVSLLEEQEHIEIRYEIERRPGKEERPSISEEG